MTVLGDEAIECIWHETLVNKKTSHNSNRDEAGLLASKYKFTILQMEKIVENLRMMIDKYGLGVWENNANAQDLVVYFEIYKAEVTAELDEMYVNPAPTAAPNSAYHKTLAHWYNGIGKGNRYSKRNVQGMLSFWPLVAHLHEDENEGEAVNPYLLFNVLP